MHGRTKDGRSRELETEGMKDALSTQEEGYKLYSIERPIRPSPDADQG